VSDDSSPASAVDLDSIWADLTEQHYALTNDHVIGLPNNFRETVLRTYFNDHTLRHDEGDWPVDRKRARDVVGYQWHDGRLHLREYDTITITDRAGIAGKREHSRVWLLDDPEAEKFVRAFLSLVPPDRRQPGGTVGINLFRTFTNVVTKPHHDDEEFVMLYVLDRIGGGAESYLYGPDDVTDTGQPTAEPLHRHQLNPGEILIFEDEHFKHGATPLQPLPGGTAQRDVLICTVDYPETYLGERRPRCDESTRASRGTR
jgi:2-oxoglutarate-Fe(II)-dependent dioxygenase family protein